MTPEERAMALLYEDYVPESQPIISDEVLRTVNRIGSYADRLLKNDLGTIDEIVRQQLRGIALCAGDFYHLWVKKPSLLMITTEQKKQLFKILHQPVSDVIGISTLILANTDNSLTNAQEFNVRTINEMAYSLLKQLQQIFG
ncbi:MAG: hypothetical protein RLP44_06410 [Aggregatilineales bacterium]